MKIIENSLNDENSELKIYRKSLLYILKGVNVKYQIIHERHQSILFRETDILI